MEESYEGPSLDQTLKDKPQPLEDAYSVPCFQMGDGGVFITGQALAIGTY